MVILFSFVTLIPFVILVTLIPWYTLVTKITWFLSNLVSFCHFVPLVTFNTVGPYEDFGLFATVAIFYFSHYGKIKKNTEQKDQNEPKYQCRLWHWICWPKRIVAPLTRHFLGFFLKGRMQLFWGSPSCYFFFVVSCFCLW